jgi:cephalosporin hydroxylase
MDDLKWADARAAYYQHIHIDRRGENEPKWRGIRVVKFPSDLLLYSQVIYNNRPDWIIETGTAYGGSALFLADMLSLFGGNGKVITIDIEKRHSLNHPRIEAIEGSSVAPEIYEEVKRRISGKVMVVLDSNHRRMHVIRELRLYGRLVTRGQFMVVEDSYTKNENPYYPARAIDWYLAHTDKFQKEPIEDQFIFAVTRGGWLRRR